MRASVCKALLIGAKQSGSRSARHDERNEAILRRIDARPHARRF